MTNTSTTRLRNKHACVTNRNSRYRVRDINLSNSQSPPKRKAAKSKDRKRLSSRSRNRRKSKRRSRVSTQIKHKRSRSRNRHIDRVGSYKNKRQSRNRKRSKSRKVKRRTSRKRISNVRSKSRASNVKVPTEMHLTIPDSLVNSDKVIPVELEINSVKYYYPIIPTKLYLSDAKISNGNKAFVKINPRLICNTQNMATIIVPESYEGDVQGKSIVPFHKPESDTKKEHDDKVYALKLRENERGSSSPQLTIIIYENKDGEWVRLDSEGAELSPNNYIAAELTKKDFDKGKVELTANNGDKITVPVKGDPPSENDPPAIITVTRPPEKKDSHWTITDVVIGITLGGFAVVLGNFLFNGELLEKFVYEPSKAVYDRLKMKFAKEDTPTMRTMSTEEKDTLEVAQRKNAQLEATSDPALERSIPSDEGVGSLEVAQRKNAQQATSNPAPERSIPSDKGAADSAFEDYAPEDNKIPKDPAPVEDSAFDEYSRELGLHRPDGGDIAEPEVLPELPAPAPVETAGPPVVPTDNDLSDYGNITKTEDTPDEVPNADRIQKEYQEAQIDLENIARDPNSSIQQKRDAAAKIKKLEADAKTANVEVEPAKNILSRPQDSTRMKTVEPDPIPESPDLEQNEFENALEIDSANTGEVGGTVARELPQFEEEASRKLSGSELLGML